MQIDFCLSKYVVCFERIGRRPEYGRMSPNFIPPSSESAHVKQSVFPSTNMWSVCFFVKDSLVDHSSSKKCIAVTTRTTRIAPHNNSERLPQLSIKSYQCIRRTHIGPTVISVETLLNPYSMATLTPVTEKLGITTCDSDSVGNACMSIPLPQSLGLAVDCSEQNVKLP